MMASTAADATAEPLASDDAPTNSVSEATADDAENSSPKRAKLDEGETSASRKTRGSMKCKRSDAVMIAEAKAAFGDLDTSEGRRLRKRSDPSKVEEGQIHRRNSKRKSVTKQVEPEDDEDSTDDTLAEGNNGTIQKDGDVSKPEQGAQSKEVKPEEDTSGTKDGTDDAELTAEVAKKEDDAEKQKTEEEGNGKSEDKEEKNEASE